MTPRISKAINIFLEALKDGTLAKGTCTACAVGNLVAAGMDAKVYKEFGVFYCDKDNSKWNQLFVTMNGDENFKSA